MRIGFKNSGVDVESDCANVDLLFPGFPTKTTV